MSGQFWLPVKTQPIPNFETSPSSLLQQQHYLLISTYLLQALLQHPQEPHLPRQQPSPDSFSTLRYILHDHGLKEISAEELLKAITNNHKQEAHHTENNIKDNTKYVQKTFKGQDWALERYK
jgi:hypothetical protein